MKPLMHANASYGLTRCQDEIEPDDESLRSTYDHFFVERNRSSVLSCQSCNKLLACGHMEVVGGSSITPCFGFHLRYCLVR